MSDGLFFFNLNGVVSIDENSKTYVYMGKYGPFAGNTVQGGVHQVTINCVGVPIIYVSCPYNQGDRGRSVNVSRVMSLGNNQWRVTLNVRTGQSQAALNTYLRVFGRLDLNYPNGSGDDTGFFLWDDAGSSLIFDSGFKMHCLAGNTYDTEIVLPWQIPDVFGDQTGTPESTSADTAVVLPFDLANKSICCNTRGFFASAHFVGSGGGFDEPTYQQWDIYRWGTSFGATGSTLSAYRTAVFDHQVQTPGDTGLSYTAANAQTAYSRLAVIDNTRFP